MPSSPIKTLRDAALNTAWRVCGQRPPARGMWLDEWMAAGGKATVTALAAIQQINYPPRLMRGNTQAILPTIAAFNEPQRGWYHDEWKGDQKIIHGPARVATLPGGRVFSNVGLIVTDDDVQIADFSGAAFTGLFEHSQYYDKWLPRPRRVTGSVAVLACGVGYRNYYHWVTEVLPRIGMLQEAGLEPDYYFLPVRYRYHLESLQSLGIARQRCITANKYSHIQADTLYVMPNMRIQIEPAKAQWLYAAMADRPWSKTNERERRHLYIARRPRDPRNVVNEAEVMQALRTWNFEKFYLEDLNMQQQVELFQQAGFVIGPHGAGLVNTVFCKPGTRVLEIGTPARPSALFYYIAHNRDLHYCNYYGEAIRQHGDESDIRVCPAELTEIVAEMLRPHAVAAA